jgi:hypothetical protein
MGRKKQLHIGDPELTIRELVIRHGVDPVDELLKMVKESLPWPDDPTWVTALLDKGYEPRMIDGKKRLIMGAGRKAEILCKLTPFMYPSLKSSEHREQKDLRIEVTVKQFGQNSQPRETITVDVPPLLAEEVKKE